MDFRFHDLNQRIQFHEILESTQRYALDCITKSNPKSGTAILTFNQTAGVGQFGRKWQSEPQKNMAMSIVFSPPGSWNIANQFGVSMFAANTIADFIEQKLNIKIALKWPNDLISSRKKLGGILINNTLMGQQWEWCTIGIGININQELFDDSIPDAISLKEASGQSIDLISFANEFYEYFMSKLMMLDQLNHDVIKNKYLKRLLGMGQAEQFLLPDGQNFHAVLKDIDATGKLGLEINDEVKFYSLAEIRMKL